MPFKLESFSAPRTRVVHVHHHHYSDSVHDSSEDEYDDYEYEEDNYEKDKYEADDYEEDEYDEFEFSENTSESECSGEIGSDSLFTTSCDDDSSFSGYEESCY